MKHFREWLKNMHESVSVYIKDVDYSSHIKNLDDIAELLKKKVIYPMMTKLSPEIQAAINDGGGQSHGIITPDGSYYSDQEMVLNFYTEGWPIQLRDNIVKGIEYFLKEIGATFQPPRTDKSGMYRGAVVRFPITGFEPSKDIPANLNMSNDNAQLVLHDILGIQIEDGFAEVKAVDLLRQIDNVDPEILGIHSRDPYSQQQKGGNTQVYHGGYNQEQIQRSLQTLKGIAQWAVQNGYQDIYFA